MAPPQPPDRRSGLHHAIVVCMATALFFLLWLGVTVIGDSARNSALVAFTLTLIFVVSLYWSPRSSR
ncbi:MAG TPA: hypothetical protein VFI12_01875 [Thermomicrobiales bacterium]|jgi:hypothetical protein|nr:hypothetical protein [Thermomicrobiales bacterium]